MSGNLQGKRINSHLEMEVYQLAFRSAMRIFELSKRFPPEEKYSLTDQICRSSRAVCANISEAWRKRRYEGAFLLKLNDAEAEACETRTWLQFAVECDYLNSASMRELYESYNLILGKLVNMVNHPGPWLLGGKVPRG